MHKLRKILAVVFVSLAAITTLATPVAAAPIATATSVDDIRWSEEFQPEHADVLRLYRAFFNREAELEGAQYWIQQSRNGANLDDIAWAFANGPEFKKRYGNATDAQFVAIVYQNVLGRNYDQDGFNYWLGKIQSGELTRHGAVRWIAASPEFRIRRPQAPAERYYKVIPSENVTPGYTITDEKLLAPQSPRSCAEPGYPYGAFASEREDDNGQTYVMTVLPFRTAAEATNYLHTRIAPAFLYCNDGWSAKAGAGIGDESFAVQSSFFLFQLDVQVVRKGNVLVSLYEARLATEPSQSNALLSTMISRIN